VYLRLGMEYYENALGPTWGKPHQIYVDAHW